MNVNPLDMTPRGNPNDLTLFPPGPNDPPASPVGPDPDRWLWQFGGDGTAADSVIRAETSIGTVEVAGMTPRFLGGGFKFGRPRIESPKIGTLRIGVDASGVVWGEMAYGVVWSGRLDYQHSDGSYTLANNIANDYALVTSGTVTCVSPWSDLWFKLERPTSSMDLRRFDVLGDLLGEVHMPDSYARDLIWIGGRIGDWTNSCGCIDSSGDPGEPGAGNPPEGCANPIFQFTEDSPRGNRTSDELASNGRAARGAVFVLDPAAWEGQLIINGVGTSGATASDFWRGLVRIGGDPVEVGTNPPAVTFAVDQSQPTLAPDYDALAATLGDDTTDPDGGAIGLAPFALHRADCLPNAGLDENSAGQVTLGQFFGSTSQQSVRLRFYGPILNVDDSANPAPSTHQITRIGNSLLEPFVPVTVTRRVFNGTTWVSADDVTSRFRYEIRQGPNSLDRDLFVRAICGAAFEAGVYRVTPRASRIRSKFVDGLPPVRSWGAFYFQLVPGLVPGTCGVADVAGLGGSIGADGMLTADDIVVYLQEFFNGNLAVADIVGLGGSPNPPDGAITVDDLVYFLQEFFASHPDCNPAAYSGDDCTEPMPEEEGEGMRAAPILSSRPVLNADALAAIAALVASLPEGEQRDRLFALVGATSPDEFIQAFERLFAPSNEER